MLILSIINFKDNELLSEILSDIRSAQSPLLFTEESEGTEYDQVNQDEEN